MNFRKAIPFLIENTFVMQCTLYPVRLNNMKAITAGVNKTKTAAVSVKQNTGQVNGKSDVSER